MMSFAGNNPFIAAIIPLTVLAVVIAAVVAEQGAVDYLAQRSTSLQVDLTRPLSYRELDAPHIVVLVLLASTAAALPAYRFYELLKQTLAGPADRA
jgi:ABC-type transporter Mla maintaining outer membrane lipid asymmetry permease subunit MlaE